jgi:hypothetical protein
MVRQRSARRRQCKRQQAEGAHPEGKQHRHLDGHPDLRMITRPPDPGPTGPGRGVIEQLAPQLERAGELAAVQ